MANPLLGYADSQLGIKSELILFILCLISLCFTYWVSFHDTSCVNDEFLSHSFFELLLLACFRESLGLFLAGPGDSESATTIVLLI